MASIEVKQQWKHNKCDVTLTIMQESRRKDTGLKIYLARVKAGSGGLAIPLFLAFLYPAEIESNFTCTYAPNG